MTQRPRDSVSYDLQHHPSASLSQDHMNASLAEQLLLACGKGGERLLNTSTAAPQDVAPFVYMTPDHAELYKLLQSGAQPCGNLTCDAYESELPRTPSPGIQMPTDLLNALRDLNLQNGTSYALDQSRRNSPDGISAPTTTEHLFNTYDHSYGASDLSSSVSPASTSPDYTSPLQSAILRAAAQLCQANGTVIPSSAAQRPAQAPPQLRLPTNTHYAQDANAANASSSSGFASLQGQSVLLQALAAAQASAQASAQEQQAHDLLWDTTPSPASDGLLSLGSTASDGLLSTSPEEMVGEWTMAAGGHNTLVLSSASTQWPVLHGAAAQLVPRRVPAPTGQQQVLLMTTPQPAAAQQPQLMQLQAAPEPQGSASVGGQSLMYVPAHYVMLVPQQQEQLQAQQVRVVHGGPRAAGMHACRQACMQAAGAGSSPPSRVFVGNLHAQATEVTLNRLFAACGRVLCSKVMYNSRRMSRPRSQWRSREFGFVDFATPAEAQRAIALLHGAVLPGVSKYGTSLVVQQVKTNGGIL